MTPEPFTIAVYLCGTLGGFALVYLAAQDGRTRPSLWSGTGLLAVLGGLAWPLSVPLIGLIFLAALLVELGAAVFRR